MLTRPADRTLLKQSTHQLLKKTPLVSFRISDGPELITRMAEVTRDAKIYWKGSKETDCRWRVSREIIHLATHNPALRLPIREIREH